jgi:hypothetical protein
VTHFDGARWGKAVLVPGVETKYSEADPAFGPDGNLYFISDRPKSASDTLLDYDIWFMVPRDNQSWSAPKNFERVNSDSNEFYISFTANGNLYFSSAREGGFGKEDIYISRLKDHQYTTPVNLGGAINSSYSEYDPCISVTEDFLVFTSSNRKDSFGGGDLYFSRRTNGTKWRQSFNLGKPVNTDGREYCAYFSPDSKYFFFSSHGDVNWVDAKFIKRRINSSNK